MGGVAWLDNILTGGEYLCYLCWWQLHATTIEQGLVVRPGVNVLI